MLHPVAPVGLLHAFPVASVRWRLISRLLPPSLPLSAEFSLNWAEGVFPHSPASSGSFSTFVCPLWFSAFSCKNTLYGFRDEGETFSQCDCPLVDLTVEMEKKIPVLKSHQPVISLGLSLAYSGFIMLQSELSKLHVVVKSWLNQRCILPPNWGRIGLLSSV